MSTAVVSPVEFTAVVPGSPSELSEISVAKEPRMRTSLTVIRTFVMAFLVLASSLGAVFASPAQDAAASHGTAVTLSGTVGGCSPYCKGGVTPFRWTSNGWVQGSTYATDRYGNFALSLSRDHYFFIKYGYHFSNTGCLDAWNGATGYFYLSGSARLGTLYPSYTGRIC